MKIENLEQAAKTTPREFMAVEGFGKKCLCEVAETLEKFYSALDTRRLAEFADVVELWRPYFTHPDRIPVVPFIPKSPATGYSTLEAADDGAPEEITQFNPTENRHAQILIQDLPISTRARNVLKEARVRTLNDLALTDPNALIRVGNCGRGTIAELAILLRQYFVTLPKSGLAFYGRAGSLWLRRSSAPRFNHRDSVPGILFQPETRSVMTVIEQALAQLGGRAKSITILRMGLVHNQPRRTLEAIGREFHLTRERVRQIVEKSLRQIARSVKTSRPDVYRVVRKLILTDSLVTLDEVIAAVPDLGNSEVYDIKACVRILLAANRAEAHAIDPRGTLWGSSEITRDFMRKVLRTARDLLHGIPSPCEQVGLEVARSLRQFDEGRVRIIQKLLLNAPEQLRVEVGENGTMLYPPRQTDPDRRRAFIYSYIKEQGVPVNIREIFSSLQDSEPELVPDSPSRKSAMNAVSSLMERDDRFAWAGQSTWGLREWGYLSRGRTVAEAALELLRASSAPLSTTEIAKALSHLYRVSAGGVSMALRSSEGVTVRRDPQGRWRPI